MLKTDNSKKPIAFLDSGVGGISVLNEAIKMMPHENYIYLGDSGNAPYGVKPTEKVRMLTEKNVQFLLEKGAKAVVIACNTATSAAADYLREKYRDVPIIGVEPAVKPAALDNMGRKILVMATPVTLIEKKFKSLMDQYEEYAQIIPVPCGGLMEFVERGQLEGAELQSFLGEILTDEIKNQAAAIVLGCTHYPFIKNEIKKVTGHKVKIYDGGKGTAKQLQRRLGRDGILNKSLGKGSVEILNSLNEPAMIELSQKLIIKNHDRIIK